jgi:hypothetical protein
MCLTVLTLPLPPLLLAMTGAGGVLSTVCAVAHSPSLGRAARRMAFGFVLLFTAFGRRRVSPPPSPAALAAERIVADTRDWAAMLVEAETEARALAHHQLQDPKWCEENGLGSTAQMLRMMQPPAPRPTKVTAALDQARRAGTVPDRRLPKVRPSTTDRPPDPPPPPKRPRGRCGQPWCVAIEDPDSGEYLGSLHRVAVSRIGTVERGEWKACPCTCDREPKSDGICAPCPVHRTPPDPPPAGYSPSAMRAAVEAVRRALPQ